MDTLTHALSGALVGAAMAADSPELALPMALLGAAAGSLPDLDFLSECWGKRAAWRLHRILLHGLLPASLLAAVLALLASWMLPIEGAQAVLLVYAALALHLLLDLLTSFGTCIAYPLSRRRFSFKSHFIVDPVVLALCVLGLGWGGAQAAGLALSGLGVYLLLSALLKRRASALARRGAPPGVTGLTLEPAFLAPWRWLVIATAGDRYLLAPLAWGRLGPWHEVPVADPACLALARTDPLLRAVLEVFEFPVCRMVVRDGQTQLVLEDLKWWTERPFRPLAFTATVVPAGADGQGARLAAVRQGGFFVREGPSQPGLPVPTPHAG